MTLKRKAIYVSWQGSATKRIISIKRPRTHVSLKKKEEKINASLHKKNVLENVLLKLTYQEQS